MKLGLIPAVISPYVIEKIGFSQARSLFLTAEIFNGKKARDLGLVHQISLDRYFDYDTEQVAESILKNGPEAVRAAKQLILGLQERSGESFEEIQKFTCQKIADLRVGKEAQEGMAALLEKEGELAKGSQLMSERVLIANRGEIAVRVIKTARRMGLKTFALATEKERGLPHTFEADVCLWLPEGTLAENYLNQKLIIDLCQQHHIDYLHPGYGFLSENPEFAESWKKQKLSWLVPMLA